jgi:hypothetical protein
MTAGLHYAAMKRAVVCLMLSILPAPVFAERWKTQYFYDEALESMVFEDLVFPSAQRGIAIATIVDDSGKKKPKWVSMVTSDGGAHWTQQTIYEHPRSLFFLNDSDGWMVTDDEIWFTQESGRNWKHVAWQIKPNKKIGPTPPGGVITRVAFVDLKHGFALGLQKSFYETTNGGSTWTPVLAGAQPTGSPTYTSYSHIVLDGKNGVVFGAATPPRRDDPQLPDWMEPERAAKRRQVPTLVLMLKSMDAGTTWNSETAPLFGAIASVRMAGNDGLAVFQFNESFDWPAEVYRLDARSGKTERVFREKLRVMDCALFPGTRAYIAGVYPPGKLNTVPIPGKVTVLSTTNWTDWTPMVVDYKANARSLIMAGPDAEHQWIGTDTGIILHLVP